MMKNLLLSFGLFSSLILQAQIINIPDANFKNALVNTNCVDINGDGYGDVDADTNDDGEIQLSEAETILRLMVDDRNIINMEGIQSFVNLTHLKCNDNDIVELNINNLVHLVDLNCSKNNLTTLNVMNNVNLVSITCGLNEFTAIDFSQNSNIRNIDISNTLTLTSLDITHNENLETLFCLGAPISTLDTSQNLLLETLWMGYNNLTTLDLSNNINLRVLYCHFNQLTSLNIKNGNNSNMITMHSYGNSGLACILVDDVNANRPTCLEYGGWCKDENTVYSEDCVLAAQDFNTFNFELFPNPTENMLNIQSKIPIENIKIYSLQGVLVNEYTSNSIDVSQLSSGMYFVEVMADGKSATQKFIKM